VLALWAMQVSITNNSNPSFFCMNRTQASTLLFSVKSKYLPLLLNIELIEPEVAPLFHSFYLEHILACITIFPLMHPLIHLGYWVVSLILTTINLCDKVTDLDQNCEFVV
jgi:hypothetical protein